MSASTRVLLMDDDPHQREQTLARLRGIPAVTVVEPLGAIAEFEAKLSELLPADIIFIALGLASDLRSLSERVPSARWIVLTASQHSPQQIFQVICDGASGEIPWDAESKQFEDCVDLICQQCPYISARTAELLSTYVTARQISLSPNQRDILKRLTQNQSIPQIAAGLKTTAVVTPDQISERTVKAQLDSILRSLHQSARGK